MTRDDKLPWQSLGPWLINIRSPPDDRARETRYPLTKNDQLYVLLISGQMLEVTDVFMLRSLRMWESLDMQNPLDWRDG